jgi:hypothetical protein
MGDQGCPRFDPQQNMKAVQSVILIFTRVISGLTWSIGIRNPQQNMKEIQKRMVTFI